MEPHARGTSPAHPVTERREEPPQGPRLLDRLRDAARLRHLSRSTERVYSHWVRRYSSTMASGIRGRWGKLT